MGTKDFNCELVTKIMALVLALIMCMAMGVTAFAADDGSVTVNNAVPGEKYNIYKVFDLTYSGDGQTTESGSLTSTTGYEGVAYTYTKKGESDAFLTALQTTTGDNASPFTLTESTTAGVYNVKLTDGKTAADISAFLKANASKLSTAKAEATAPAAAEGATTSTVAWSGLAYGYYYVTSSVGTTVTIDSTLKDVVVEDKNSVPTEDKKQSTTEGSGYTDDEVNVSIGDKVYYEVTVTDGKGTNLKIELTDTMSDGLTNNKDYVLYKNSVADDNKLTKDTDYTVDSESDHAFKITLKDSYVESLSETDKVILRYSATLNENAITQSETGVNKNTIELKYSNQTQTDEVEVTTMKLQIVKDNKDKELLTGAKFKIYTAATGGDEIKVVKVSDGNYRVAKSGETGVEIEAGTPVIKGLKAGKYYLEETEAPSGYNKLTSRVEVTVSAQTTTGEGEDAVTSGGDNLATFTTTEATEDTPAKTTYKEGGVEVINQSGTELPSTGGIGTTIFYVIGAVLVIGAGVLLVTRRRMRAE